MTEREKQAILDRWRELDAEGNVRPGGPVVVHPLAPPKRPERPADPEGECMKLLFASGDLSV